MNSQEKGKLLEQAVSEIEKIILENSKNKYSSFEIITNYKKMKFYEIDLFVKAIDLSKNQEDIFIFECKNWKNKIERKHITDFSEKIKLTKAKMGFL